MVGRGELRLPEMQRRYVWRATRVRDLIDSLYRGYPSGAVLVWETDQDAPTRNLDVAQATSAFATHKDYEKAEINEIANFAFISGRANRAITNKEPKKYLPEIIKTRGEEALWPPSPPIFPLSKAKLCACGRGATS